MVSCSSFASSLQEEFKGNWSGTFTLKDGSVVTHEPNRTSLGFMSSSQGISMKTKNYNRFPVSEEGIQLKTNSTKEEFIAALVASGLYDQK